MTSMTTKPDEDDDTERREVTVVLEVDQVNPAHAYMQVWVGRDPGSRGDAGLLTLRVDELIELLGVDPDQIVGGESFEVEIRVAE